MNTAVVFLQVFYYADRIFLSAGVDNNNVQYVTVSIGAINVVMTLLAVSFSRAQSPLSVAVSVRLLFTSTANCFAQ